MLYFRFCVRSAEMIRFFFILVAFLMVELKGDMIILFGERTPNESFRIRRLEQALQKVSSDISAISEQLCYFVDVVKPLEKDELDKLCQILNAHPQAMPDKGTYAVVVPRIGTLSAWSSKATDIVHNCDLASIKRIEKGKLYFLITKSGREADLGVIAPLLHDRMLETVLDCLETSKSLFFETEPQPLSSFACNKESLGERNHKMGLALSVEEIEYLVSNYTALGRDSTDVELMTFAQINSEHCRHKVFNANWKINGKLRPYSLFEIIKNTHRQNPQGILSAYSDNAAVMQGPQSMRFFPNPHTHVYEPCSEEVSIIMKVETHNHPTSICPFPGAATGVGGQIRDEGATGCGGKPKAGLAGYCVSNLRLPDSSLPWEKEASAPSYLASPLKIMIEGPLGSSSYNNEFGRPNLLGYFRTYEQEVFGEVWGYHKPIMLAGGMGNIRPMHVQKQKFLDKACIIVLGGPSMAIGVGGGAASSMTCGTNNEILDFASVQRANPEMQRRCQEVIDQCAAMGEDNPILSIHDVGAGGLSNAVAELVASEGLGCAIELRSVPNEELRMTPLELWCNESQERYVLALDDAKREVFEKTAKRERCPFAVIGKTTAQPHLRLSDSYFHNQPIDLPLSVFFANSPHLEFSAETRSIKKECLRLEGISLEEAANRILLLPTVAEKTFLIHIGDRSVTGLVARDQMVGPWQVPVSDVAVTASSFDSYTGEAMAIGERPPIAILDARASARMAVGEAITNIASANIQDIRAVKLSVNWQVAAKHPGEGANLYEAAETLGLDFCPKLGVAIPVGKDSVSMQVVWKDKTVTSPLSINVTAFAPVKDIRKTVTPQLRIDQGETALLFIDLGEGKNRLGGSCLAQVINQIGDIPPDLEDPEYLKRFFKAIQRLNEEGFLLAYHDRSDGGLFVTALEMAFAGHCGLELSLDALGENLFGVLFSEELGALIQVRNEDLEKVWKILEQEKMARFTHAIGVPLPSSSITFLCNGKNVLCADWSYYRKLWAQTTFQIQSLRDHPELAKQELEQKTDFSDPGLHAHATFAIEKPHITTQPRVAILREQGTNGHSEMAAAFHRAGFIPVDVHMSDIISGVVDLNSFQGLVACGGFSYGDVLGAGRGWAMTILNHPKVRTAFEEFFKREDTFSLGVCNGCQMLAHLKELIPGTDHWPLFVSNHSTSFEARVCLVEITPSPSLFFKGMEGSRLPIVIAHGEGRAEFHTDIDHSMTCMRFIDHRAVQTQHYPENANGSPYGITGLTSVDGRVTLLMPHPERVFRKVQHSWHPDTWNEDSPWIQMFYNAYSWVAK